MIFNIFSSETVDLSLVALELLLAQSTLPVILWAFTGGNKIKNV